MSGILDFVTQSSGMTLDELNARTSGTTEQTANEIAVLMKQGVLQLESKSDLQLTSKTDDLGPRLAQLMEASEEAASVYVIPTAKWFRQA